MPDQVQITTAIAANVRARMDARGITMEQLYHAMLPLGGPDTREPLRKILSGDGAVRNTTQRALCEVLRNDDEKTLWEVWGNLRKSPARVPVEAEYDPRLAQDYNPDSSAEEEALLHRIVQPDMFGGDDIPATAPKRKGLEYAFPTRVDVFHHLILGTVRSTQRRGTFVLRRILRRAL